jgi:hypothetical protein
VPTSARGARRHPYLQFLGDRNRVDAVVFFDRFDGVSGRRAGRGCAEGDNLRPRALLFHRHVEDFAVHWAATAVQLRLGHFEVGSPKSANLDVPDVLAGHCHRSQAFRQPFFRISRIRALMKA